MSHLMKFTRTPLWNALILMALLLGLLGTPQPVSAAMIQVNVLYDDYNANMSTCSLREAIIAANYDYPVGGCPAGSGDDVIFLGPGIYTLSIGVTDYVSDKGDNNSVIGDLDIGSNISFVGAGVDNTIIKPADGTKTRVFHIMNSVRVSFQDLTIQGGYAYYPITPPAPPELESMGGGIYNEFGYLTLSRVTLIGNAAHHSGGGLFSDGEAKSLYIIDTTIRDNVAEYGDGGGLVNESGMVMSKSLVWHNTAVTGNGGGISNVRTGRLTSVTITQNETLAASGVTGRGSGIFSNVVVEILNSTIVRNVSSASNRYGIELTAGRSVLINNIIAYNSTNVNGASAPANCKFDEMPMGSHNMREVADLCEGNGGYNNAFINTSSNINLSNELNLNMGRTMSYALLEGSAAIDGGDPDNLFRHLDSAAPYYCSGSDQRWARRPVDSDNNSTTICDVGAVEVPNPTQGLTFIPKLYLPQINR